MDVTFELESVPKVKHAFALISQALTYLSKQPLMLGQPPAKRQILTLTSK